MNRVLLAISIGIFFLSCGSSKVSESTLYTEKTMRLTVASQRGDCVGVVPQKCLIVKTGNSKEWTFLYYGIKDFKYEEGSEYVIEVQKRNVKPIPADASSFEYVFVKEISKTSKQSEGLPK